VLPATGASTHVVVAIAVATTVVGVATVAIVRRRSDCVVLAFVIVLAVSFVVDARASAATTCSSTVPTTGVGSVTGPTTTLFVPAVANVDEFRLEIGESATGNILANDFLGMPQATIGSLELVGEGPFDGVGHRIGVYQELPDDAVPLLVAMVTIVADGSITVTGVAQVSGAVGSYLVQIGRVVDMSTVAIRVGGLATSSTTTTAPVMTPTTASSATTSSIGTTTTTSSTTATSTA
jgi:hypothetical protein